MNTFKEQFDKLTEAYIKGNVEPYHGCACFVGNLLNGNGMWEEARGFSGVDDSNCKIIPGYHKLYYREGLAIINMNGYTVEEIISLEQKFLQTIHEHTPGPYINQLCIVDKDHNLRESHSNYEEALFLAFCETLDVLKQIHEDKGEEIEPFVFVKRKFQTEPT